MHNDNGINSIPPQDISPSIFSIIGAIVFCLIVLLNYLGMWDDSFASFHDTLFLSALNTPEGKPIPFLTPLMFWVYSILGIIFDAIIVSLVTALTIHFFPRLNNKILFLIGLIAFLFGSYTIWELIDNGFVFLIVRFIIIMFAVFYGYTYVEELLFDPEEATDSFNIGGVKKRIWVLLIVAFNPIVLFLIKMSIILTYSLLASLSTSTLFDSLDSIVIKLGGMCIFWFFALFLFSYGFQSIQNKNAAYRHLRIVIVFVVIPLIIVLVPLIRNQGWFF